MNSVEGLGVKYNEDVSALTERTGGVLTVSAI